MTALAVAGMACRYADASSPDELWENVLAQRRAFRALPAERLRADDYLSSDRSVPDRTYSMQAALIDGWEFDRGRFRISGKTFRAADAAHWLALDVAADALADAGYPEGSEIDRARTVVVVGNTLTGEVSRSHALRLRWPYVRRVVGARLAAAGIEEPARSKLLVEIERDYKAPFEEVDDETLAGALSNTIAGRICNAFDFKGGGYTVDGACAASLLAVATAAAALERGEADVALAGGVDLSLDPFELVGFAKAGALAPTMMRVYDKRSEGFWPGEGCGFVVLRRLDDMIAEGLAPDVAVRGWGISSDGAGGIIRPELEGQVLALERAYAHAGFDIASVDLFEGHGTGTAIGDATELSALNQARVRHGAATAAAIGSVKANIGHTKAAAGVAGLIKAAVALRKEVIPPTTGCDDPRAELLRDGSTLRVVRSAELWPGEGSRRAGVSAMGFGGINAHVVLERSSPPCRRRVDAHTHRLSRSAQDTELFLFSGSRESVAAAVDDLRAAAPGLAMSELGDVAATLYSRIDYDDDVRGAILASTPAALERGLHAVVSALEQGETLLIDEELGVAVGTTRRTRIAFLFSGQAAEVGRDGGALGRRFRVVREAIDLAALDPSCDLIETANAQPAIVTSSLAGLALMRELGVEADVAIGHSLGELTALHWGRAFDAAALVGLARARGRAMSELADRGGGMLGLTVDEAGALRLCSQTTAVVAGVNAPRQTVVAGDDRSLEVVERRAREEGLTSARLRVSHAFHSPLVAAAVPRLQEALTALPLAPLHMTVVSTITGEPLPSDADLRGLLVRQVTSPVRFLDAVRTAGDVDLFVEIGPGRIVQRLVTECVETPAVALEVGSSSLRPALFASAALFASGALNDAEPLFSDRFVRPLREHRFIANPCESAPADTAVAPYESTPVDAAVEPASPVPHETIGEEPVGDDPLAMVRALVAQRAELPLDAVQPEARLLADLHLSSIVVAELVAAAARQLGVAAPAAPGELATATVAGVAEALARLATTAPGPEPARIDGVASWARGYERVLVERKPENELRAPTTWTIIGDREEPLVAAAKKVFAGSGSEDGVLLVVGSRHGALPSLLVEAAQTLSSRRPSRFALVECGQVAASFARTLHLETGIPCSVIGIDSPASLDAARREAESVLDFAEVRLGRTRRVPVLRPLDTTDGDWPMQPGDVALVTGGGKGITAECALALAGKHGLALSLLGRSDPEHDGELAANLRRFAAAGVRHMYTQADVRDPKSVREAVRRTEIELGPVSGIFHGAGVNAPALLGDLDETSFRETFDPKVKGLANVLAAVDGHSLRLLVTFGSIIGALGLAGEAHYALANESMRESVAGFAESAPQCRCVDIAWSVWAGAGMGERLGTMDALIRAGVDPIPLAEGIALLERLICARNLPNSILATGRFGPPPTIELERPATQFRRFLERRLVDYPGIELVVEADLDIGTDPYLADHRLHGVALLPAVVGIEAMAQVAEELLGSVPRALEDLTLERPVTIPTDGKCTLRIAALRREDGSVDAVLRSDESSFQADHFRATFRAESKEPPAPLPTDAREGSIDLDPNNMYDALLFHGPRFRRLGRYRHLRARSCVAEVETREAQWFGAYLPQSLALGDAGSRDAFVHVLQACIPDTRVLPTAVDHMAFLRPLAGTVVVNARERADDGTTLIWDVDVDDVDGQSVEQWRGLRLRRIEPMATPTQWPEPLLVPYFERRLADLSGRPIGVSIARDASSDDAISTAADGPLRIERAADGRPVADVGGVSASHAESLTLAMAADDAVACDVEEARPRADELWRDLLGSVRLDLAQTLSKELQETLDVSATRIWAVAECSRKAGRSHVEPLTLSGTPSEGWALVRAGTAPVATFAGRVSGSEVPLAFAFLVEEKT
jgi:enediyne polyketide synthase